MAIPTVYDQKGATPGILKAASNIITNPMGVLNPIGAIGKGLVKAATDSASKGIASLAPTPKVVAPVTQSPSSYPGGLMTKQTPTPTPQPAVAPSATQSNTATSFTQPKTMPVPGMLSTPLNAPTTMPAVPQQTPTVPTPNAFSQNVTSLTNIGSGQENPQVAKAREDLKNFQTNFAQQTGANSAAPIPLEFSQGRNQVLANQYNSALPAYQGAVTNSLESQSQQIGAAQQAGSLSQPVGQFGVLTNPQTGQPVNGLSATEAAQQGGYIQGLQSGAQALGAVGGTTNAANAADSGTQAFQLDTALKQVGNLQPLIGSILKSAGINQTDYPKINALSRQTVANLNNPALAQQWDALMVEYQNIASKIIDSGGVSTPSGVQAAAQLLSPQNLPLGQIQSLMQTIEDGGNARLSALQKQTDNAAPNSNIYQGKTTIAPTSTAPASPTSANIKSLQDPYTQAGLSTIGNIASNAFNFITNPSGALSGLMGYLIGK